MLIAPILVLFICLPAAAWPAAPAEDEKDVNLDSGKISQVTWSDDGKELRFVNQGKSYCYDLKRKKLSLPDKVAKPEKPPQRRRQREDKYTTGSRKIPRPGRGRQYMAEPSPDGKWYAVCKDWNVVLENDETKKSIRVTTDGHRKFRYGTANWVYGEEINVRHGMWWAPDGKKLIFYEFDERPVEDYYLTSNLTGFNTELQTEGYMKAGAPNPVVSLLIYDLKKKKLTPVDTGDEDQYIYNMRLAPDGSEMLYNRTDRRQKRLDVTALDFKTGRTRIVVTETQDTWQDNSPLMRFLEDGERFIWETEKTGWQNYELRHLNGKFICTLTRGEYPASRIEEVDEESGWLYYTAYSGGHPLNTHLNRVRLNGTGQARITTLPYNHSRFSISPDRKWVVARYEDAQTPASTALYNSKGDVVDVLAQGPEVKDHWAELFTFKADDGVTDLYGTLYKPEGFDPNGKYPLIVPVYGGPGSRSVNNTFSSRRGYTQPGFLFARIDNRGTSGRGKAFLGAVYEKLGDVDIGDQAAGVRHLRERSYVNGKRVGIYGGSYGGYMAALGVMKHPDVFHAAVNSSGVTDWRHYDTIYTERYMNLPQDNPEGYDNGSCMAFADRFTGKLLIAHGMLDDNVHPNNAWQLIDALDKANKKYESRFFPRAGHGTPSSGTRWEFFERHLKAPVETVPVSSGYSIPIIDLADEEERRVVVDREEGQYLGHPTTALLEDKKTMICVYPKGHGGGAIVMKRSTDTGKSWSKRLATPKSWEGSKEVPTIFKVEDADGVKRLILFSGLYPIRMSVSGNNGETWSELEPIGEYGGIVAMGDVIPLKKKGCYMAMFHDDGRFLHAGGKRTDTMEVYTVFSSDGGLTWSEPETIISRSDVALCEPGAIRSPDGNQIAVLMRENSRRRNSFVIFSDDEGRTWTEPRELPGSLTGDRHTLRYAPDGRIFATFRDTCLDSPTQGDWVGWVGTYEDIVNSHEGAYRVRLMDNHHKWDCAYPGLELLDDGTFAATTYGHWVEGEEPFIVSVRFKMNELDERAAALSAQ